MFSLGGKRAAGEQRSFQRKETLVTACFMRLENGCCWLLEMTKLFVYVPVERSFRSSCRGACLFPFYAKRKMNANPEIVS